eukprot:2307-Heterococcus_DN1.PRE.2
MQSVTHATCTAQALRNDMCAVARREGETHAHAISKLNYHSVSNNNSSSNDSDWCSHAVSDSNVKRLMHAAMYQRYSVHGEQCGLYSKLPFKNI